ncbi:hypothetical protein IWZ00DRAFT_49112 [Phyllosticta capitalensis]|uniref:DUF1295 domain protein n=1 Tax=Phyllosticta capitalensis TaxID=121624 RepID=A0ABR1Z596_9PEZI
MAEQDKYGSHWSSNPSNPVRDSPQINIENLPKGAGAEQDRYGGWFGGKGPSAEQVQEHLPKASGAEQDRYGGWFGGKAPSAEQLKEKLPTEEKKSSWFSFGKEEPPKPSAAEQDRYGGWFGGKAPSADKIGDKVQEHLPKASGAEQDRLGGWFGGKSPSAGEVGDKIQEKLPNTSGAEQDRLGGWFGGKSPSAESVGEKIQEKLPNTSGAEQDRYSGWFGGKAPSADKIGDKVQEHLPRTSGAEQDRYGGWFGGKGPSADQIQDRLPHTSGAEQDRYGSHFGTPRRSGWTSGAEKDRSGPFSRARNAVNPGAVGLLQSAILPSFGFHTGTSLIAYGISRYTDRIDGKDWLWPTAPVANAWWSAVGTRVVYDGLSLSDAWSTITYPEKLLLTGVTAWGGRLFYHIASRSIKRGEDDARYTALKKEDPSFWNKALFTKFVPEAVVQTIISLPFTLPFREGVIGSLNSLLSDNSPIAHSLAVFLFTTGFALEVLADSQLQAHTRRSNDLYREGVWSIVRHPNYLGDALIHLSFPALLYSAGIMHPLALLAPVANYAFLRFVGGDKENEASQAERYAKSNPFKYQQLQAYRMDKNSFWPSLDELKNKWTWAVLAVGAGGAILERGARAYLRG